MIDVFYELNQGNDFLNIYANCIIDKSTENTKLLRASQNFEIEMSVIV